MPLTLRSVDRSRAWAATRFLAGRAGVARMQAAMRSANVALRFDEDAAGITFSMYVDGNRNGVRTQDIVSGIDPLLAPAARLSDLFPGVAIALEDESGTADPVRVGASNLLSFTPLGTATSGSIYVRGRDGSQFVVRVLGATGRTRVLRYRSSTSDWVEAF